MSGRALLIAMSLSIAVACRDKRATSKLGASAAATSVGNAMPGSNASPSTGSDAGCVKEGAWALCSVEDRLVHAGLVVERRDEAVRRYFMKVPGVAYQLGAKDDVVEIYIYPTVEARKRDTELLDSATVSPNGTHVIWSAPPTLVTSNNMAAIILSLNDRTVERLALALGAGLPQGDGKKD
ncbi:MAG: hypothetical protein ABIT38_16370 [Gemmatimonadaceae bacterium]